MDNENAVYRTLQKHLNNQAVGFPATITGRDIKLLKHLFTPEHAKLATFLNYKYKPLENIHEEYGKELIDVSDLDKKLTAMALENGCINYKEENGTKYFATAPLIVGIYEYQLPWITDNFLKDFDSYISSVPYGIEFLSTEVSQMRTIPVEKSITPELKVSSYDNLLNLIEETKGSIFIHECICRKTSGMKGEPCTATERNETCMAFGDLASASEKVGTGRKISKEEALEIARMNQKDGLILQPSNSKKIELICACCGCCCGMLGIQKKLPRPLDFWSTNYYASLNSELCNSCGICSKKCQLDAISKPTKKKKARINLKKCIGCGNCVVSCKQDAIELVKKSEEQIPPETTEDMYELIMDNKKDGWEKFKMTAKLVFGMKQ